MTDAQEHHILVLDDDPTVTRSIEALIRLETEWTPHPFNQGEAAIASMNEAQVYSAIVSDFMMPDMDGIKFLTRARQLQPAATRVMLTGYADKANAIRSINEVGLYQYIEKPWDNDGLLLVMRNAVERFGLVTDLDEKMRALSDRDSSLEEIRSRLLKAIL